MSAVTPRIMTRDQLCAHYHIPPEKLEAEILPHVDSYDWPCGSIVYDRRQTDRIVHRAYYDLARETHMDYDEVGIIYVIRGAGKRSNIKIGYTGELQRLEFRIQQLQTGSPVLLRLIHAADGTPRLEKRIHALLGEHRLHGEWFAPRRRVWQFIETAMAEGYLSALLKHEARKDSNLRPPGS